MSIAEEFSRWPVEIAQQYRAKKFWRGDNLALILMKQASIQPGKVALIDAHRSVTYGELKSRAELLALRFDELGLARGDAVVLHMPNCVEFFEVLFACLVGGIIPILALPGHREHEVRYFCCHAGARAYISRFSGPDCKYKHIAQHLKNEGLISYVVASGEVGQETDLHCVTQALEQPIHSAWGTHDASDMALLQLSGGTTGTPKLIPRTHDDYFYSIRASVSLCKLSAETVYLAVMPLAHNFILSSPGSLGVLQAGGTVVISDNPAPANVFQLIEKHRITLAAAVPPLVMSWLNAFDNAANRQHTWDITSLKVLQVGGAKLSNAAATRVKPTFGCTLQQVFGMAEGLVNYTRLTDSEQLITQTQGRPLSTADEVLIVNDHDEPVKVGVEGHLLTRGPYTIRGYFRAPEHNRLAFTPEGFYRTGDLVRQLPSGHIVVTGRSKDQINRGGEKIAAEEIENHCLSHGDVLNVAVIALPDPYIGERTCAVVVLNSQDAAISPTRFKRSLTAHLRSRQIADFKIPDRIEIRAALPTTQFGKVDKKALLKQIIDTANSLAKHNKTA